MSKEVFLTSVRDEIEANFIESLLKEHGIHTLKKHKYAGQYVQVIMGSSTSFGLDFYVPEAQFEEAKEIIASEPIPEELYEPESEEEVELEEAYKEEFYRKRDNNISKALGIILILVLIPYVISLIW